MFWSFLTFDPHVFVWTAISPYLPGQRLFSPWRGSTWIPSRHYCGVYAYKGCLCVNVLCSFYDLKTIKVLKKRTEIMSLNCSNRSVLSVHLLVSFIQTKMDHQVIGYKDLAAIPKDKAILDIERPDRMMYQPHFNYSPMDRSEVQNTHNHERIRKFSYV